MATRFICVLGIVLLLIRIDATLAVDGPRRYLKNPDSWFAGDAIRGVVGRAGQSNLLAIVVESDLGYGTIRIWCWLRVTDVGIVVNPVRGVVQS